MSHRLITKSKELKLTNIRKCILKNCINSKKSLTAVEEKGVVKPKNPWVEVLDPKGSGQIYYWNKDTNETTPLGSPKPSFWVEIKGPNTDGSLTYWWNPETNETTALGAPKPPAYQTIANTRSFYQTQQPQSLGGSMVTYALIGASMTLGMIMVRLIIG